MKWSLSATKIWNLIYLIVRTDTQFYSSNLCVFQCRGDLELAGRTYAWLISYWSIHFLITVHYLLSNIIFTFILLYAFTCFYTFIYFYFFQIFIHWFTDFFSAYAWFLLVFYASTFEDVHKLLIHPEVKIVICYDIYIQSIHIPNKTCWLDLVYTCTIELYSNLNYKFRSKPMKRVLVVISITYIYKNTVTRIEDSKSFQGTLVFGLLYKEFSCFRCNQHEGVLPCGDKLLCNVL